MRRIEAEQAVIGALLQDNTVLYRLPNLKPEHFFLDDHRIIFSEIVKMIREGKSADPITVGESFDKRSIDCGGFKYLAELSLNTASSYSAPTYAAIVMDDALRRTLSDVTAQLAEETNADKTTPAAEILEKIQASVMGLSAGKTAKEPVLARHAMASHIDVMSARTEGEIKALPTGFGQIDYMLNGGMNPGNMIIVGARPSMGKTAFALNIAANVAKSKRVLFLSQEMGTDQLLDRLSASLGKVDLSAILQGQLSPEQWQGFTAACAAIESLNLLIDEQGGLTINDVRMKARRIKQQYGLDLLVVDYLQLMSGPGKNRNEQIEEISRGLKNLAKELDITVIVLSQLNREVDKRPGRRPVLSDLRDSGSIEQDADVILFIHRDEVSNPESHLKGWADVLIAKNRQGRIGDVALKYRGEYTLFESTTENKPLQQQTKRKGLAEHL
jgi:replicative DNA helicase